MLGSKFKKLEIMIYSLINMCKVENGGRRRFAYVALTGLVWLDFATVLHCKESITAIVAHL